MNKLSWCYCFANTRLTVHCLKIRRIAPPGISILNNFGIRIPYKVPVLRQFQPFHPERNIEDTTLNRQ